MWRDDPETGDGRWHAPTSIHVKGARGSVTVRPPPNCGVAACTPRPRYPGLECPLMYGPLFAIEQLDPLPIRPTTSFDLLLAPRNAHQQLQCQLDSGQRFLSFNISRFSPLNFPAIRKAIRPVNAEWLPRPCGRSTPKLGPRSVSRNHISTSKRCAARSLTFLFSHLVGGHPKGSEEQHLLRLQRPVPSMGVSQVRRLHLLVLCRRPPRTGSAHLLREEHFDGCF